MGVVEAARLAGLLDRIDAEDQARRLTPRGSAVPVNIEEAQIGAQMGEVVIRHMVVLWDGIAERMAVHITGPATPTSDSADRRYAGSKTKKNDAHPG